jgi:hypothetical protein
MQPTADQIEHAARTAWDAFALLHDHEDAQWRHQRPERQERWRAIARAVLKFAEPSAEAERLRSQHDGLRRAYEHACEQRDKYMRRTAEWRDAAMNDGFRRDAEWLATEVGREHIKRCEVEQCDTCSGVLGIEERLKDMSES